MPRAALGQVAGRVSLQFNAAGTGLSPAALIGALQGGGSASAESLQLSGLDPKAIEAATQAADRGMPIERIGDVVRGALDTGRLNIPQIDGAIAIADGRVTLGPLKAPAQGADVAISANYGLGEDALDLRFALTGAPKENAAQRPQLSVALKGPLDAARRSVDTSALVHWLTSRAVELEARRLEAAEEEAKRIQAEQEARRRAEEAARRAQEAAKREKEAAAQRAAQEAAQRAAQEAAMPTATPSPPGDKAPALPPVIEIAPVPAGPERKPRPPQAPSTSTTAPGAPLAITPPAPR